MKSLEISTYSDQGGRPEQQDAVQDWRNQKASLTVLADGVGGNIGGAAASKSVIASADNIWKSAKGVFSDPESKLKEIAKNAHEAIRELNPNERRSPATTIVALYICGNRAHWIHCGDSRLYQLRNDQIIEKTRDHSIVQILLEKGEITEDEVNTHPDKSRILRTLGSNTYKEVEYNSSSFESGDIFLLCSDGYWESVPYSSPILPKHPPNQSLQDFTTNCVKQAVERNGAKSDNTTLALVASRRQKKSASLFGPDFWKIAISIVFLAISFFLLITSRNQEESKEPSPEEEPTPAESSSNTGALPPQSKSTTEDIKSAEGIVIDKTKPKSSLPDNSSSHDIPKSKDMVPKEPAKKPTDSLNPPAEQ